MEYFRYFRALPDIAPEYHQKVENWSTLTRIFRSIQDEILQNSDTEENLHLSSIIWFQKRSRKRLPWLSSGALKLRSFWSHKNWKKDFPGSFPRNFLLIAVFDINLERFQFPSMSQSDLPEFFIFRKMRSFKKSKPKRKVLEGSNKNRTTEGH